MKLSNETVEILKNFSDINPGVFVKAGSKLETLSPSKQIFVEATVSEVFPIDFGVYDLKNLLTLLSLTETGDIEFHTDHLTVTGYNDRMVSEYGYTDKTNIICPPDKAITLPSVEVTFILSEEDLKQIMKTVSSMGYTSIAIQSDGATSYLVGSNTEIPGSRPTKLKLSSATGVKYNLVFKAETFKLLPDEYTVQASKAGMAQFSGKKRKIVYSIATVKKESSYDGK